MRSFVVLLALALGACDETPPMEWGPCLPDRVRHVERFGYYAGGAYLPELAGYSNLSWGGPAALPAARAAGVEAVVDVQGVFAITAADPAAQDAVAARWAAMADQLRPDVAALAALYPSDEPYLSGEKNGVAPAEVQRRLEAAARLVHSTPGFENARLAAIFSDRCLDIMESGLAGMPAGYDWVGWDLYRVRPDTIVDHADRFLSLLRPEQRFIAVPDAFVPTAEPRLRGLKTRIATWLAWIEANPKVVAVTPFRYQSSPDMTGARDIPSVRARFEQIGGCILAANAAK